jgi:hypothetical protein
MPTNALAREYIGDIIMRKAEQQQGLRRKKRNPRFDDSQLDEMASVLSNPSHVIGYSRVLFQHDKPVNKKDVRILNVDEINAGHSGVSEVVLAYIEENLDNLVDSDEFKWAITEFLDMRDYIIDEDGTDIVVVMIKALENVIPAVERLKQLIAEFHLGEVVKILCRQPELSGRLLSHI